MARTKLRQAKADVSKAAKIAKIAKHGINVFKVFNETNDDCFYGISTDPNIERELTRLQKRHTYMVSVVNPRKYQSWKGKKMFELYGDDCSIKVVETFSSEEYAEAVARVGALTGDHSLIATDF